MERIHPDLLAIVMLSIRLRTSIIYPPDQLASCRLIAWYEDTPLTEECPHFIFSEESYHFLYSLNEVHRFLSQQLHDGLRLHVG